MPNPEPPPNLNPEAATSIEALAGFLVEARAVDQFLGHGQPVVLEISPGNMTRYVLAYTPAGTTNFTTDAPGRFVGPRDAIVTVVSGAFPSAFLVHVPAVPPPAPLHPSYVEGLIAHPSGHSVAAVGVVTSLMLGCDPAEVARSYAGPSASEAVVGAIAGWNPSRFTGADREAAVR